MSTIKCARILSAPWPAGTPGSVTAPSSLPTTIPTGDEPTGGKPTGGEPSSGTSSNVPATMPSIGTPTGVEPSGGTSSGSEPQSGRPPSVATSAHSTPTGDEPSKETTRNSSVDESKTHTGKYSACT